MRLVAAGLGLAVACWGCAPTQANGDAGTPDDAGVVDDAGTSDDAGEPPDAGGSDAGPSDAGSALQVADCLEHTRNEGECKDCCDCLEAACASVVSCRDQCPTRNFAQNSGFITVSAPSVLGPTGDYSACTSAATEPECKACCDCEDRFACGDQRFCRDACAGTVSTWPPLRMADIGAPRLLNATFQFAEGPVWDSTHGVLLLSDITADTIYRYEPGDGGLSVVRSPSARSNGLAFDLDGRLLAAEHGSRSVTRLLDDGGVQPLAATYQGKRFNSPNDLLVRTDGTVFFTDPTYGLGMQPSELGFTGLYRVAPDGGVNLEATLTGQPNGVELSPGERNLYVTTTTTGAVWTFGLASDGGVISQRTLATVEAPDGLAVDAAGNLYVAALDGGAGVIAVIGRDGRTVGTIPLGHQPTNCVFGGADLKSLFVTARAALYVIAVPIPGNPPARRP
jgi:gluconolactonase